ncbi:MAG TPA: isoprenylcysteine carboxylmethyltransferase family protein [Vicinamibacterales bacterium]|jgi:protein-S-isoprenylcysteine O-methyltransferase Ste14
MFVLRALASFILLPGVVGFLVPALLAPPASARTIHALGVVPFVAGVILLLWCVREFYVAGKGTLAPWDPPRHLVVSGPYRYSRNPMYVGVALILIGWAITFETRALWLYAFFVIVAFHLRVVLAEEPWQARTFPREWDQYKSRVPRWLFF